MPVSTSTNRRSGGVRHGHSARRRHRVAVPVESARHCARRRGRRQNGVGVRRDGYAVRRSGTMATRRRMISDWDDAYANAAHIRDGAGFPICGRRARRSSGRAARGRARRNWSCAYGDGERERLDLFHPDGAPKGLVCSCTAATGCVSASRSGRIWRKARYGAAGRRPAELWALPACAHPDIAPPDRPRRSHSRRRARRRADRARRPFGGRPSRRAAGLRRRRRSPQATRGRLARVVSISGVHDLRPLMRTAMNATLRIDEDEAYRREPGLLRPRRACALTAWVGADERPEFVRQSELIANVWTGLGAETKCVRANGRHHYDVIEELPAIRRCRLRRALALAPRTKPRRAWRASARRAARATAGGRSPARSRRRRRRAA